MAQENQKTELRKKFYLQERVNPSDTYDEIMQKIYDGEREKEKQDDAAWDKEQEELYQAEQHEAGDDEEASPMKVQANVNDIFKWKDDDDGY